METKGTTGHHSLTLTDRKTIVLEGVEDVRAFDEKEVMLATELGMLMIRGQNLQVQKLMLENGIVELTGAIDGLIYSEKVGRKQSGESALRRLFG